MRAQATGLSRRHFLAALSAPLLTGACGRGRLALSSTSVVGLFPASTYETDLADVIFRGLRELGAQLRGRRVLLKPNMVEYEYGTAINTHPLVVAGAVVACRRAGAASVVVAEGPGHRRDAAYLLSASGLGEQLRELRIPFTDLNHDDVSVVPLATDFTGLGEIALPVELLRSDFVISMPKLKTHHWAGMTCSMKNLFGVVPGAVYGWPKNLLHVRGINRSILDLTSTVRPQLAIVDGIIAMEGDGPIMGRPRPLGFIAMGADPVAVDATCARVIGLAPDRMPYLQAASGLLGNLDEDAISQRGESPSRYTTAFDLNPDMEHLRLRPDD